MNNLTTRKIVLGLLMTLVLAFSMQGIADALTLTNKSGDLQSKAVGSSFDISFSVGLTKPQDIENTDGQPISQSDSTVDPSTRIDGSGFVVEEAGNGEVYRTTQNGTLAAINANAYRPTGYSNIGTYNSSNKTYETYNGDVFAESDREAFAQSGEILYYYETTTEDGVTTYQEGPQAKIQSSHFTARIVDKYRFHYNEEAIKITVSPAVVSPAVGMTVKLKNNNFNVLTNVLTKTYSLSEDHSLGLPNPVTLICETTTGSSAGTYTITIEDVTPNADLPSTAFETIQQQSINFTLYVGDDLYDDDNTSTYTVSANLSSVHLTNGSHQINRFFSFQKGSKDTEDASVVYQVVDGPGTLFVKISDDRTTSPTTGLETTSDAPVFLNVNSGSSIVVVSLVGENPNEGARITFYYTGTGAVITPTTLTTQQQARLLISVSGETVTVNALTAAGVSFPGILVTLSSTDFALSQAVTTGTPVPITLPSTAGSYSLFARHPTNAYAPGTATVTVAGPALGTLTISPSGTPVNGVQNISITARTADTTIPPGALSVTLSGTGFTPTIATVLRGSVIYPIVLSTVAGTYTLTARATGYDDSSTRIVVGGATTTPTTTPTLTPTPTPTVVAEPSSIQISGPAARSGTVNQQLDSPLLVRVLGDNGSGVENARVIFRVISGRGRLSERGNGRAVGVQTDSSGYARANFTPTDDGTITVRASATGVTAAVTFTISTGSVAPTGTPGTTTPRTTTPRTTTSRAPVVHVAAASRPPMLWVDGGAIYALVGASPQRFAASVDNALNIAIGGGKVYWTEKTGESGGTINSANLNGSGVTELVSILAVPMGIAVDTAGSKLYWTNSRGRIQSAALDGSGITNVMQNLPSPMDLALAGGNAYWTQGNGSVRFVNLRGQKVVRNVSTGTDTPGSLVIGGGKVYWTEMTGESGGTVNSANLNGTGATPLASILAAPMGIAVDGSRSKLYWSNSRGRIQSANLDGSGITNVVSGLGSPGDMVLSNSIAAPAATTTTRTTTTASNKYDVNGDGSVNNADSDAITVAIAAGATDAKYDVNGDGTVNVFDLVEIIANRDPGAAGAPTLFGMKMSAVQIDFIQEQIDLLIATNDRSPAAMRTLIYLQQLLVTARPEKTQLLANYPNPFNPETWIPYELATDTHVRLTIYNTQGVVIRTLQLGHQSAGYYTGRDRAAYWDGRNALGERVASGLYFYQLETDEMSLTAEDGYFEIVFSNPLISLIRGAEGQGISCQLKMVLG